MDKPYPIIRRHRRSLIIEDAPPVAVPPTPPVQPGGRPQGLEPAKIVKPDDADNATSTDTP